MIPRSSEIIRDSHHFNGQNLGKNMHKLGDGFEVIYGPIVGISMIGWYRMTTTHQSHVAWQWHIWLNGDYELNR